MEKEQLELFSGSENTGGGSGGETKVSGAFLQYLRAYEKTVLIIILLLAVSVLSFIAGVEKGKNSVLKRLAALRQQQETAQPQPARQALPAAQSRPAAALQRPARHPTAVVSQQAAQPAPAPRITGKYTVQLASYKSKEQALKEAQTLQKRGLAPAVIYLRPYYVLCSGSFQESRTAELWRLKLKKQYRDCYVRRL
ncbi:MAG: SPOR domain-containing protein [Candidatus Omnitrophota bacterium]|jgi:hypothetical protein